MEQAELGSACLAAPKRRFPDNERCGRESVAVLVQPVLQQIPAEEEPEIKQRKKEQEQNEAVDRDTDPNLMDFCDELLFEIFQYLDTSSILAVMHCSPRFENLLLDHRFYHHIDLSNGPLPMGILEEILGRATEKTHTIKICGPPSSQHVAGEFRQFTQTLSSVFPRVVQLKVLELQGVSLDFEYIHITEFPATLKRLKLKDCSVRVGDTPKSIFYSIELHLLDLEDLSIEDNSWFEPYYIMGLSKLPSLRRLSLKGCQALCKFVPYGSMAARFGFQKLESLDLRQTPINNSDLQCFSAIENLKELLLESPQIPHSKQAVAKKTSNGNATDEAASPQPDSLKVLSDDEPSTSRAAMEHLRACKVSFNLDNCNERKEQKSPVPTEPPSEGQDLQAKRIRAPSESDDEDTSSTSGSSSDKSEVLPLPSNGHNGAAGVDLPPRPHAANAGNAANLEAPVQDTGLEPRPPRAYIYVPDAENANNPRQQRSVVAVFAQGTEQRYIYVNQQFSLPINVLMPTRRHRTNPRPNYDQVVSHPMFWNMLEPLDRDYSRRVRPRPLSCQTTPQYYVTDRAMYSFGRADRPVQPDVVWIRNINRSPDNRLERLSLRNYHLITNHTLEHLVQCSPNLVYIDVSGTSVTLPAIRRFRISKPKCEVVANHLEEIEKLPEVEPQEEDDTVVVLLQPPPRADGDQPPKSPPPQEVVAP
ncbi:uncharacterized protein LOC117142952 [Drosophila mauritiana]|uniref:Uncharacterized protein LOC117142952 n=1 Tax=Drosophila mauritiana TaxID=7226 RepID=A0A6P8K332_DROMA|nr:uncharacterized protein LOC117142952 [Drosophila mauritiana]